MIENSILDFYKQTSMYTDFGLYSEIVKGFSDDIKELCELQRKQIIHPFDFSDENIMMNSNSYMEI